MNNMVFRTQGDWDTTTLENNGAELQADRLFVEMITGRDDYGEPNTGGIGRGGEITAIVVPMDSGGQEMGIFPGRLEIDVPGHNLVLQNTHPAFVFETTQVWYNGREVGDTLLDIHIEVDAVANNVSGYISLFKNHWFGADEVMTFTLL